LVFDNPAERLLSILENGKGIVDTTNCRQAWHKLLILKSPTESELMSRLGRVMDLPHQIVQLLDSIGENDDSMNKHWITKVSAGFMQQNLNSAWSTFNTHIDAHSISYLKMCSKLLRAHSKIKGLTEDELDKIREQLQELIQSVESSDIDPSVKEYLFRSLKRIIISIDEYFITGVTPLIDSIETTFGHAVANSDFRDAMKKSDIGEDFWDALFKVSSVVSLSVGFPELAAGASALLLSVA